MMSKFYRSVTVRELSSKSSVSCNDVSEQLAKLHREGNWLDSLKPFQVNWHLLWFM
jgi:hypothetical protein